MSLELLEHGWLMRNDELPWVINGVSVDPATRTRREEYTWALDMVRRYAKAGPRLSLDAATGYVPTWHMWPYILSAETEPTIIFTCDHDERTMSMPYCDNVVREMGDLMALPYTRGQFDIVTCISTLEHLTPHDAQQAAYELHRVLAPGAVLIVTADEAPWLPALWGFSSGAERPDNELLTSPGVYAAVMRL